MSNLLTRIWRRLGCRGIALIELLGALAITGIVVALATTAYVNAQQAQRSAAIQAEIQEYGRASMDYMVREVQSARKLVSVGTHSLTLVNSTGNKLTYRVQAATLYRDFFLTEYASLPSTSNPITPWVSDVSFAAKTSMGVLNGVGISLTMQNGSKVSHLENEAYLRIGQ